jgi:hypothetical protein
MVDVYTKMKPDSFKSQLQAVLTTYYEDIKGVQGGSCCHKTRIVKRQFENQEDDAGNEGAESQRTQRTQAQAPARWTQVPAWRTPAPARRAPPAAGRRLQLLHLPPALSGRRGHGLLRRRLLSNR